MEAFRVLPPLAGKPPPPAPHSPRVAPRYVQQKDSSAFVVLAEVGAGAPPSSPFRGRGFKGSVSSKIPVKSAPTSPGPRAPKPLAGKSAPSSPSKAAPAKRFAASKLPWKPPSPRKNVPKTAPRPRFVQKAGQKDDPSKTAVKKTNDADNNPVKKHNDNNDRLSNKKANEKTEQAVTTSIEKEGRRVKQLNTTNSVPKVIAQKPSAANASMLSTSRSGKAAVERAAVIMDRVNRLRPERQMVSSTRSVKRNSLRSRRQPSEGNPSIDKNGNNAATTGTLKNDKKAPVYENTSEKSVDNNQGNGEKEKNDSVDIISSSERNSMNPSDSGVILPTLNKNETESVGNQGETMITSTAVDIKPTEKLSENTKSSELESSTTIKTDRSVPDDTIDSSGKNGKMTNSTNMNLITPLSNSTGDVKDTSSTSQSSSQLTLVTGTTKVNVEPVKETSVSDKIATLEINKIASQNTAVNETLVKNVEETINSSTNENVTIKTNMMNEVTPNGVLPAKTEAIMIPNGGDILQNKIIIMQSDKNGTVKVIGSEPVSLDMEEVLRESIVTETAVPTEDLLVRKQPDLIPSAQVEEPAVTVIGQPDLEVQAGNHTVTFRFPRSNGSMEQGLRPPESTEVLFNNGKCSPEIHPVSARPRKRKTLKELCGCCRPASKGCSWRLPWFKKRNGPGPPPPPKVKKKRLAMPSLLSCCSCKKKANQPKPSELKVTSEHVTPSEAAPPPRTQAQANDKRNLCRKVFCCGCKKKGPATLEPPRIAPKKKSYWRKVLCCCCPSKSSVRPRPQQSQELLKNRRREMSKSRTTSIQSGFSKLEHSLVEHSSMMKAAIPVLPICLAWTCLILNVFLPGTGTMTSGILCLCFGKPRFSVNDTAIARFGAFCINLFIGLSQIFTIIFCLVGWGWSIWWGVIMLKLARKHRRIKMAEKASQPQTSNQNDIERGH